MANPNRNLPRPVLLPVVLIALAAALPAAAAERTPLDHSARVVRDFALDGELSEWETGAHDPILLDSPEQRVLLERSDLSRNWAGPADLSGRFWVGVTETALILAGEVRDDVLTLNRRDWWLGDEIEFFFDFDLSEDEPNEEYSADDYQLLLFPLGAERTWGFATAGPARVRGDAGFDGVRVAAKRKADEEGRYLGYTFEAAIPLVNLPLRVQRGTTLGFALALVDADGEFGQKTYMTVDGKGDLATTPSRFGRLVIAEDIPLGEGPEPPAAFSLKEPALILAATLLLVFLLWRFRRVLTPLTEIRVRAKFVVVVVLLGLVVLSRALPAAERSRERTRASRETAKKGETLARVLAEARQEGLLGEPETGPEPARILALLKGNEVAPPESYAFRPGFARPPSTARTLSDRPVLDYGRKLAQEERAAFEPPDPIPASEVVAVLRYEPDRLRTLPLTPQTPIAVLRILLENGEAPEASLLYERELDDAGLLAEEEHAATNSDVAWRDREAGTHADEFRLVLPDPDSVVRRVEVEQVAPEGNLTVHGVTLLGPGPESENPLPAISSTLVGVPTNLWEDRPAGATVLLRPGSEPHRIPLHPPVDRVWIFAALPAAPPTGGPEPFGRELLTVSASGPDGPVGEPVVLRNGIHVDREVIYGAGHPPEMTSPIGFRWTPLNEWPRHRDAILFDPADREAAEELVLATVGEREAVLVAGITEGRLSPHVSGEDLRELRYEDGRYRLSPANREDLRHVGLTWYRRGRAELTSLPREEGGEAVLGTALPAGALSRDEAPPEPEERTFGSRDFLTTYVAVDRPRGDVLQVALPLPSSAGTDRWGGTAFYVLLGLLLLTLLLLVADLLSRLPRIRTKLTLGFAVAALVPLLLFFFGLSGVLERELEQPKESTLLDQLRLVRGKFAEVRDEVRRQARVLLKDEELLRALASAGTDPAEYREQTTARLRELAATASPLGGPGEIAIQDTFPVADDPGPRTLPEGATASAFGPAGVATDDLSYSWSRAVFGGVASTVAGENRRRTVAVEVPIGADLLESVKERFGRRFEILLFTMRGYPYAGTLSLSGEQSPSRAAPRRRIAEEIGNPVVREETIAGARYTVAYDLLRTRDERPVALLALALPRREFIEAREEIRNLFLILGAVILVLEVIVGNILTRRLTDPLTAISRGARSVAAGNLDTRVTLSEGGEIGVLADSFNRMTGELSRRIDELSKLNAGIRSLSGSLERDLVIERAGEAFRRAVPAANGLLLLWAEEDEVEVAGGFRGGSEIEAVRFPLRDGLLKRALEAPKATAIPPLSPQEREGSTQAERDLVGAAGSAVAVPFATGRSERAAVLLTFADPDPGLAPSDLEFLSTMAQQVGIALENASLYRLAIQDVGTGLYVHSYFLTRLREETDRATAGDRPLSLLLVGLGEVDWVYDTYGPQEGDHVMNRIVRRIRSSVRGIHVMARADRDTIELILPETEKEKALGVARSLREELSRTVVRLKGDPSREIRVTPAVGLATCPDDAGSAEFLLAEAHQALYKAITDRSGGGLVDVARERRRVHTELKARSGRFVFRSEKMLELLETVDRIAASDVPILVLGETGVGKEVLAELVHEKSRRHGKPLVKVNCAALPEALLESELFGHERGAFTGADRRKPGRFELADGGTIFLDEIGEIPPQTQVKLLRVLQDHRVERLGGTGPLRVDVRVIAATNLDLSAAIREGRFREDLYFRLNVVSLVLPPLRARKEEIPALVESFLAEHARAHKGSPKRLSPAAMDRLFSHSWPGNVRELRNTIERACVIARGDEIEEDEIVFPEPSAEESRRKGEEPETTPRSESSPRKESPPPGPEGHEDLNFRQRKLLEFLEHRETITNREYADLVGVSARTGNRDIGELIERGLIEKIGRKRAAVYRLNPPR